MKTAGVKIVSIIALGLIVVACRPAQKDPPFDADYSRVEAKVADLEIPPTSPLHQVGATTLWKKTTGKNDRNERVRVAMIGTGIDYTIPDLKNSLWINPGEYGENYGDSVDSDGNGYEDDVIGFDFLAGDSTPYDWHGFDTYTSSIVAAAAIKNSEVVGVAPNAELMVLRYLDSSGRGNGIDAALAVNFAKDNGAKVVYFNWPQGGFTERSGLGVIVNAIKALEGQNILVVVPAGNAANKNVSPFIKQIAGLEHVLVVAGVDGEGDLVSFSNSGAMLTALAAPALGAKGFIAGHRVSDHLESTAVAAAYVTGAAALVSTLPGMGSMSAVKDALLDNVEVARGGESLDVLSQGSLELSGF